MRFALKIQSSTSNRIAKFPNKQLIEKSQNDKFFYSRRLHPRSFKLHFWQCPFASRYIWSFFLDHSPLYNFDLFQKLFYSIVLEGCGGSLFVEDAVVIDVPLSANCNWQIQTEKDRVLVFTVVQGGNFKQVEEFLSVRI